MDEVFGAERIAAGDMERHAVISRRIGLDKYGDDDQASIEKRSSEGGEKV
jgi:hypothetical protein